MSISHPNARRKSLITAPGASKIPALCNVSIKAQLLLVFWLVSAAHSSFSQLKDSQLCPGPLHSASMDSCIRFKVVALVAVLVLTLCAPAIGAPTGQHQASDHSTSFENYGVFTEAASSFSAFVSAAVLGVRRRLTAVARRFGKVPELQTTSRYASGSFTQEMSYNKMDNPGARTGLFTYADGWANGQPFQCGWDKGYHHFQNNALVLDLKKDQFNDPGSASGNYRSFPFTSAEFRSYNFFGSGCYTVCMKSARDSGVSSSFYAHSGEYDVPTGFHDPNPLHNEIDVEFIGKDTWGFQSNYFSRYFDKNANSGSGNEGWHPLDFDTAAGYHTYTFKWTTSGITWWADGAQVRHVGGGNGVPSPNYSPMRVVGNVWPVNEQAQEWAGPLNPSMTYSNAKYKWIVHDAGQHCGPSTKSCPISG